MADYMKVVPESRTGRIGVSATQFFFEKLGFIFREQPIEDYGIDAQKKKGPGSDSFVNTTICTKIRARPLLLLMALK
jgi:hypothetical protein